MAINDLLYVSTHLTMDTSVIPDNFTFEYSVIKPERVYSPVEVFGEGSMYVFRDFFSRLYDPVNKVWLDGDTGAMPAEEKAAVLIQQMAYDNYQQSLSDYNTEYNSLRPLYYRRYLAEKLIEICA